MDGREAQALAQKEKTRKLEVAKDMYRIIGLWYRDGKNVGVAAFHAFTL